MLKRVQWFYPNSLYCTIRLWEVGNLPCEAKTQWVPHFQILGSKFSDWTSHFRRTPPLPLKVKVWDWARWRLVCMADWGGGISVVLHRRSNCSLSQALDDRVMRRGIISSCQSAASETVKLALLYMYVGPLVVWFGVEMRARGAEAMAFNSWCA